MVRIAVDKKCDRVDMQDLPASPGCSQLLWSCAEVTLDPCWVM